jgi:hypothetical protein
MVLQKYLQPNNIGSQRFHLSLHEHPTESHLIELRPQRSKCCLPSVSLP